MVTGVMTQDQAAPPVDQALLDEAIEIATTAAALTLRWYSASDLHVDRKDDGTPVTEADRAAERSIREHLARHHPDDAVIGEEEGVSAGSSRRTWFIDPIDGTRSFVRGVPLFSTLLALEDEHGPAVGVIDLPALGETVAAGRGLGCFLNGSPTRVSDQASLSGAVLSTSSYDAAPSPMLTRLHASPLQLVTWGDAYGYALVATGRIEAMLDPIVSAWDIAPMAVIVPEAGGTFTDLDGREGFRAGHGLATNGHLHREVLALVSER